MFFTSWTCTIICCINRFTSLCKNFFNLLQFLAEAFRCHVHDFQCFAVPVGNDAHEREFKQNRALSVSFYRFDLSNVWTDNWYRPLWCNDTKSTRFLKKSMFLTDTSEDIDAHFRYIASKKKSTFFRSGHP